MAYFVVGLCPSTLESKEDTQEFQFRGSSFSKMSAVTRNPTNKRRKAIKALIVYAYRYTYSNMGNTVQVVIYKCYLSYVGMMPIKGLKLYA